MIVLKFSPRFNAWLKIIATDLHGGLSVFGVEIIETDKGRICMGIFLPSLPVIAYSCGSVIRDVDVRPDLLFPCVHTIDEDIALLAKHIAVEARQVPP